MKDLDPEYELLSTLDLLKTCDPAIVVDALHKDFVTIGLEDGLYICADADTYLRFLADMASPKPHRSEIAWVEIRGRLASACIVQRVPQSARTTVVTLLRSVTGWRVITATFVVDDGREPIAARPKRQM